jgi:hypothetical protein
MKRMVEITQGYMGEDMKLIDLAERQAELKFDGIMSDTVALEHQVNGTFLFLSAAGSAAFGYGITLLRDAGSIMHSSGVLLPLLAVLIHVCALGWVLVLKCMLVRPIRHKGNEPGNVLAGEMVKYGEENGEDAAAEAARQSECRNLARDIIHNSERNQCTGRWLNVVRRGMLLAPLTFLVVLGLVWAVWG